VEKFSCEGQCQHSLQDTARFAGTKEDALDPAVILGRTRSAKFNARCKPLLKLLLLQFLETLLAVIIITLFVAEVEVEVEVAVIIIITVIIIIIIITIIIITIIIIIITQSRTVHLHLLL